ncbi:MAG TPA: magnesium transporter CorA family protein [Candidatus Limnocylindrales bacterium]|nr:magnesium transporter CorA family protein [Candidatus Limnocylindrales bacterium]
MDATSDAPRSRSERDATSTERVRVVCWTASGTRELDTVEGLADLVAGPDTRVWIDLTDPRPEVVRQVARDLRLHPLIADDIEDRNERAKVATYDDMVHVVLFDLEYRGEVQPAEIDLVLGSRFLLSVHGTDVDLNARVASRDGVGPILGKGADFLLYVIADRIVDGYFPVLDRLADEIDDLQDKVVESPTEWTLQRLFVLKRELLAIRRATSPAREVLNQLTNREITVIAPEHVVYFRDVYDHLIRVTDELDNYRDLISGTLDIYLSTVNNNLSRIMKRLTGVTVILAGIGAVAGIFGMSEAGALVSRGEPPGFWLTTGVIVIAAIVAAVVLRRIDWI